MTADTPSASSVAGLLAALARSLGDRPYMVMGGQAVLLYGDFRVTEDIDVTVALTPAETSTALSIAAAAGLRPLVADPEAFARETCVLPLRHDATGLRVDLIFSLTDYEREALARSRLVRVGDADVRFSGPEDVVLSKVFAGRPRDLEDARGILRRHQDLDLAYVRRWLDVLEPGSDRPLQARFEQLLRDLATPD